MSGIRVAERIGGIALTEKMVKAILVMGIWGYELAETGQHISYWRKGEEEVEIATRTLVGLITRGLALYHQGSPRLTPKGRAFSFVLARRKGGRER